MVFVVANNYSTLPVHRQHLVRHFVFYTTCVIMCCAVVSMLSREPGYNIHCKLCQCR